MKLEFEENSSSITLRVVSSNTLIGETLKSSFYVQEGEDFHKQYSKNEIDTFNIISIKDNFLNNGIHMFEQMAYLSPVPWEESLLEFINKIKDTEIDWWLTGSCAMCVRGIDIKPHDIDIMFESKDLQKIKELFEQDMIEPICESTDWVTKYFAVLFLKSRIDIAIDPQGCLDDPEPSDAGPYARDHLETVTWKEYQIKVPPLSLQISVNKRRGRFERVRKIEDYIKETKTP